MPASKSPLPLPSTALRACLSKEGLESHGDNSSFKKREAVKKSVHGSTGSQRTVWHRRKSKYLAVRPALVEGRTAIFSQVQGKKGDFEFDFRSCHHLTFQTNLCNTTPAIPGKDGDGATGSLAHRRVRCGGLLLHRKACRRFAWRAASLCDQIQCRWKSPGCRSR